MIALLRYLFPMTWNATKRCAVFHRVATAWLTLKDGKGEIQNNKKQTDSPRSVDGSSWIWRTGGEHLAKESLVWSTWRIDVHARHLMVRHISTWFNNSYIQEKFYSLRFKLAAKDSSRLPLSSRLMIVLMVLFDDFKIDRINLFKLRSDFSRYRMIRCESRIPRWSTIVVEALVELIWCRCCWSRCTVQANRMFRLLHPSSFGFSREWRRDFDLLSGR